MEKQAIKINESQLMNIIAEATKRILKEGTTDPIIQEKWDYLIETAGPEQMLSSLYAWNSSNMIEQWIDWFDEEGYFEGSPFSISSDILEGCENVTVSVVKGSSAEKWAIRYGYAVNYH